jgi:hypothetical protein
MQTERVIQARKAENPLPETSLVERTVEIKIEFMRQEGAKFYRFLGRYKIVYEEKICPKVFVAVEHFRFDGFPPDWPVAQTNHPRSVEHNQNEVEGKKSGKCFMNCRCLHAATRWFTFPNDTETRTVNPRTLGCFEPFWKTEPSIRIRPGRRSFGSTSCRLE